MELLTGMEVDYSKRRNLTEDTDLTFRDRRRGRSLKRNRKKHRVLMGTTDPICLECASCCGTVDDQMSFPAVLRAPQILHVATSI